MRNKRGASVQRATYLGLVAHTVHTSHEGTPRGLCWATSAVPRSRILAKRDVRRNRRSQKAKMTSDAAMITIPRMSHAVVWLPSFRYRCAAGSSSWQTMKTIMPPTMEKTQP